MRSLPRNPNVEMIASWLVHERKFSVIPLDHPDATRHSDDPKKIGKVPALASWKHFQTAPPTDDNLMAWLGVDHEQAEQ